MRTTHKLHTGTKPRKPRKIDAHTIKAIDSVLARTIALRNVNRDQQADLVAEHLLRLLHSSGVLPASSWRA